jgi:CheY-like chemotaxis protein
VVDDNADTAELLTDLLRIRGFDVSVALPEMTGYELARRIRESMAGCRLIAVTGHADPGAQVRSLDAGFAAHLVKPVSVDRLLRAITDAP